MIRAYDDNGNIVDLVAWEKQIRADAIDDFAGYLEDMDYLNRVDIEYDYEENCYEQVVGLTKEQVISEYLEELKENKNE